MTEYFKYNQKIYCEDTDETCFGYIEYLGSQHWKKLRSRLIGFNHVCAKCYKITNNIQLHHLTYKRLGKELDSDLMPLCSDCHKAEHEKLNKKRKKQNQKINKATKQKNKQKKKKKTKVKKACKYCGFYSYDRKLHQPYCLYTCEHISSNKKGCKNYNAVGYITKYSKKTCSV